MSSTNINLDELEREYNELTADIEEVRNKRDERNQITKDLISMIKSLNKNIKQHLQKASEFKEKRDMFNELVQRAKNNRITTQIALEQLRKRLNEIKEKYKDIKPINREQKIKIKKLKSAVRAKSMEIQTKPDLTLDDEDRLIKEIEELEIKLGDLTQGSQARIEYSKVISQFPQYRSQLRNFHQEVLENSEESQKNHEAMLKEYGQVDQIREKIAALERELNENRKIADDFHSRLIGLYRRRDDLRNQIDVAQRKFRRRKKRERANVALLKRRIAKERLERGEKLDFIEFRLLFEKRELGSFS